MKIGDELKLEFVSNKFRNQKPIRGNHRKISKKYLPYWIFILALYATYQTSIDIYNNLKTVEIPINMTGVNIINTQFISNIIQIITVVILFFVYRGYFRSKSNAIIPLTVCENCKTPVKSGVTTLKNKFAKLTRFFNVILTNNINVFRVNIYSKQISIV